MGYELGDNRESESKVVESDEMKNLTEMREGKNVLEEEIERMVEEEEEDGLAKDYLEEPAELGAQDGGEGVDNEQEENEELERGNALNEVEEEKDQPSSDIKEPEPLELDGNITLQVPSIDDAFDGMDVIADGLDGDYEEFDAGKASCAREDTRGSTVNILVPKSDRDINNMEVDENHTLDDVDGSSMLDTQQPHDCRSNGISLRKFDGDLAAEPVSSSHQGMDAPVSGSAPEVGMVKKEFIDDTSVEEPQMNVSDRRNVFETETSDGGESGTEEEQSAFMKELENFCKEKSLEFKPPKFYGEPLNLLKTCTTVSWTFRIFYEKALLDYERHRTRAGELDIAVSLSEPVNPDNQAGNNSAPGSGRARRDAATRAMQGWHSHRLLGNGEVSDPIIKDKSSTPLQKQEKQPKIIGPVKRKKPPTVDGSRATPTKVTKTQSDSEVIDIGQPADWVKINVRITKDCYEVYALVPGLLREEVRVQSDPVGRLVITGEPEHPDNPWGVTPFKKVVSLPSRIDQHQTSAVVTLHGQLFVRVPFEQSD
ncbi:AT-rich interactive domain-containing protein [Drosera capensis]